MDPASFGELMSGARRGVGPAIGRGFLSAASCFYDLAVRTREVAFAAGWIRVERAAVPVISLGNVTTGGTGKTPFAAFIAHWFRRHGVQVCFLSRGYRSGDSGANDEALVLERLCPDVPHLQQPDRVASARRAVAEFGSQLLILDDGFQHRRLARDLDVVLIDALNPWGYGHLLPRGLLREPLSSLRRADLIVITRVDQATAEQIAAIRGRLAAVAPGCDIVESAFPPEQLVNASGQVASLESLRGQRVAAFCGIGNPQAFRESLVRLGMEFVAFHSFPDHHPYSSADVEQLQHWSAGQDVAAVVTTQKDLVKLRLDQLADRPLWAVQIGTRIVNGADLLERRLRTILDRVHK